MLLEEFDKEKYERTLRSEGREEGIKEGREEGIKEGIQGTVDVLRDLKHGDIEIKYIIKNKYNLSDDEAEEYL